MELDVLAGWVPEAIAGDSLITVTGKVTWLPWVARLAGDWRLRPFTAALAVTYTLGDRFFVTNPPKYGGGYYPVPTALRSSIAFGGTLGRAVGKLREVGVYWELVAGDLALVLWIQNPRSVRASEVLSLALGLRAEF